MKILALNSGSSSVKYQLYDWDKKKVIAKGLVERIGLKMPFHTYITEKSEIKTADETLINHKNAIQRILEIIVCPHNGAINDINEISAVGHRVVHGGEKFTKSVLIDDVVIKEIESLLDIAPLHNPANLEGIKAVMGVLPNTPQIAIFDTAFHQSMPEKAYMYAVPRSWYTDFHVRRYGFHGTSHLYVSKRAAVLLNKPASQCNIISLHIGNGASVTAIKNGLSVDTSMGFTPLEGVVMGTRSGDLDPAIPLFMQNWLNVSPDEMDMLLNKKSGLLGITTKYTDRRDIQENANSCDLCKLAMEMETYRAKKYIGMYSAVLGRVDAIVFTGGAGENFGVLRQMSLQGLENFGIIIDHEKATATRSKDGEVEISKPESKIKVFVIPTDEEIVFIEDSVGVLQGKYTNHMQYPYSFSKNN